MTEEQLLAVPEFATLPVYDEEDERADTITSAAAAGRYKSLRECATFQEVLFNLKNPRLVPLGALRTTGNGRPLVVAYFGERP
jgi:hypothetical protein